ncbi:MAG: glycosyl transferase group 1 [Firmicutes bacterium]|nr:glycosyl transferase group 1 [Bacillota bacterium]
MAKKNLLILVANTGIGGQERVAINTAGILKEDYNTMLAIFNRQEHNYDFDGTLINLELPPVQGEFEKIMNVFRRVRALKKLKREYKIDVTMSFGTSANLVNALAKTSDKKIVSVRGYGSLTKSPWGKMISRLVYGRADVVITVAKKLSEDLAALYDIPAAKVKTVYNPYDLTELSDLAGHPVPIEIGSPTIVSVGRMQKVKGYRHLINAMAHVIAFIPQAKLLLIGTGDEAAALQKYTEKLGLIDNVLFAGFQPNPYSYEAKCDLYALSSINEGFPNTLVEALACGLPIVAADCRTGPREILMEHYENRTAEGIEYADYGVLVPPFVSDESHEPEKDKLFAEAIIEMLTNRKRCSRYKEKLAERAGTFSFKAYREKMIEIIEA